MEARILQVATDLFIRDGFNGVSFLAIGKELRITHSNIHYYYSKKATLAAATLSEYASDTLSAYQEIWANEATGLFDKFVETRDWAYHRYLRYNPTGMGSAHWGLLDRFGHDSGALSPEMKAVLRETSQRLEALISAGVEMAVRSGEFGPSTPTDDVVLQIATVLYSSRQVTRHSGSFDRLDRLLRATYETVHRAFGTGADTLSWPPLPSLTRPRAKARKLLRNQV